MVAEKSAVSSTPITAFQGLLTWFYLFSSSIEGKTSPAIFPITLSVGIIILTASHFVTDATWLVCQTSKIHTINKWLLGSRSLPLVKFCGSLDRFPYEELWLLPAPSSLSPLRVVRWPLRGRDVKLGVRQTHGRQTDKEERPWLGNKGG